MNEAQSNVFKNPGSKRPIEAIEEPKDYSSIQVKDLGSKRKRIDSKAYQFDSESSGDEPLIQPNRI